jgi:signal transduction histidine kinase
MCKGMLGLQRVQQDNELRITEEDNRIGWDTNQQIWMGIGIMTIVSRIDALEGVFSIHSEIGKGTVALVKFDFEKLMNLSENV